MGRTTVATQEPNSQTEARAAGGRPLRLDGPRASVAFAVESTPCQRPGRAALSRGVHRQPDSVGPVSQRSGEPKIETIDQGSETKAFKIACGGIKIVDKDVAESILSHYEKPYVKPVLFRVSSEEYDNIEEVEYIQVPLKSESLDAEDVFILDDASNDTCYIWIGGQANVKERVVARKIAMKFEDERAGAQKEVFIEQGDEPEEFKTILGM